MSAQLNLENKVNTFSDVQYVRQVHEKTIMMLTLMAAALTEIAECEHSLDAGIAMRAIAVECLIDMHELAETSEVQNA